MAGTGSAYIEHSRVRVRDLEISGMLINGHLYAPMICPTTQEHEQPYRHVAHVPPEPDPDPDDHAPDPNEMFADDDDLPRVHDNGRSVRFDGLAAPL